MVAVITRAGTQGGEPDTSTAAKVILYDWQRGKIPYFEVPPLVCATRAWRATPALSVPSRHNTASSPPNVPSLAIGAEWESQDVYTAECYGLGASHWRLSALNRRLLIATTARRQSTRPCRRPERGTHQEGARARGQEGYRFLPCRRTEGRYNCSK